MSLRLFPVNCHHCLQVPGIHRLFSRVHKSRYFRQAGLDLLISFRRSHWTYLSYPSALGTPPQQDPGPRKLASHSAEPSLRICCPRFQMTCRSCRPVVGIHRSFCRGHTRKSCQKALPVLHTSLSTCVRWGSQNSYRSVRGIRQLCFRDPKRRSSQVAHLARPTLCLISSPPTCPCFPLVLGILPLLGPVLTKRLCQPVFPDLPTPLPILVQKFFRTCLCRHGIPPRLDRVPKKRRCLSATRVRHTYSQRLQKTYHLCRQVHGIHRRLAQDPKKRNSR